VCAADRRHEAGFPIVVNPNDAEQMRKYDSQTRGMDPQAVAAIEFEQPHNVAERAQPGPHSVDALFALSALQNADKHRSLAVLAPGLYLPTAWAFCDDEAIGITQPVYLEAGADVMRSDEFGNRIGMRTCGLRSREPQWWSRSSWPVAPIRTS
jgi:hypothetical protein